MSFRKTPKPTPRLISPARPPLALALAEDKGISFESAFPETPEGVPLPAGALTVNLSASGDLVIYLPPSHGHSKGHTAFLPATQFGFQALHDLLKERARLPQGKIGTAAAPTSFMLEQYARALSNGKKIQGQKITSKDIEELDLEDFDFSEI